MKEKIKKLVNTPIPLYKTVLITGGMAILTVAFTRRPPTIIILA